MKKQKEAIQQHFVRAKSEFLERLRRAGIPSIARKMEAWLTENKYRVKRGMLARLMKGQLVRPIYLTKLVQYLMLNEYQGPERRDYKLLAEYLREIGKGELLDCSPDTIREALIDTDRNDWFLDATKRLLSFDFFRDLITPDSLFCATKDIDLGTKWMAIDFAKQVRPERIEFTLAQAEKVFEEETGITRESFLASAEKWHRYDPWTCIQGCINKQRIGMCVALPLRIDSYLEFRKGLRGTNDFDVNDLERPSRFIMIQALTTNPKVRGMSSERVVKTMVNHVIHQLAMLSYCEGEMGRQPLHIITLGCTPAMRARLESDQYEPTKTFVPGTAIPIYERKFTLKALLKRPIDFAMHAAITTIGKTAQYRFGPGSYDDDTIDEDIGPE